MFEARQRNDFLKEYQERSKAQSGSEQKPQKKNNAKRELL